MDHRKSHLRHQVSLHKRGCYIHLEGKDYGLGVYADKLTFIVMPPINVSPHMVQLAIHSYVARIFPDRQLLAAEVKKYNQYLGTSDKDDRFSQFPEVTVQEMHVL
jgi:hypothetical protein